MYFVAVNFRHQKIRPHNLIESAMNKDRDNDLSSLFLPDITLPNNNVPVKVEPDQDFILNQSPTQTSDFNTFITNNDFITKTLNDDENFGFQKDDIMPHSHYSGFFERHNHNIVSNLFSGSNPQPKDPNWFTMDSDMLKLNSATTPVQPFSNHNNSGLNLIDLENNPAYLQTLNYPQSLQQIQQLVVQVPMNSLNGPQKDHTPTPEASLVPEKKRKVVKKKSKLKNNGVIIDYSSAKLTKLLDLRSKRFNSDSKILDSAGNELKLDFKGFLNGKFLTNDVDNGNYIYSILQENLSVELKGEKRKVIKADPKVISCYRRNYIQLSFNFNLSGFQNDSNDESRILKLQTNEYGYNITRVIKWFKIEVTANSNISKNQNVPLLTSDDSRDREIHPRRDEMNVNNADYVVAMPLTTTEHIITVNNAEISKGEIDSFFTIKKIRFKNATPNNGNMTFQNYYHLKIKLSAIVADLYYDDYIDEEFLVTNPDNSRNEITLFELETEPIVVRGRNPSFYADRNDLLVKGRAATSRENYKLSGKSFDSNTNFKVEETDVKDESDREINSERNIDEDNLDSKEIDDDSQDESSPMTSAPSQFNLNDKSVPPIILNTMTNKLNILEIFNDNSSYKYFPISKVYYLPPVNVVYFPHGAHQHNLKRSPAIEEHEQPRRKSSNVYFK